MIMMPLMGGYIRMLNRIMGGININESIKKRLVLVVVIMLGRVILEWGYITAFTYFFGGVTGAVIIGVYVFITIGVRLWVLLGRYVILGNFIGDNYKILGLGVLPLLIFFVKVCGSYMLLWIVMIYSMYNIL